MMKILFALCSAAACAGLGVSFGRQLKVRVENLSDWLHALEWIDMQLFHEGMPLCEAVCPEHAKGQAALRLNAFSKAIRENPRFTAKEAWDTGGKPVLPEDMVLASCFSALGSGPMEKRRMAIAQAKEQLTLIQKEAQEKADRDERLYRSMGLAGGAALFILLI